MRRILPLKEQKPKRKLDFYVTFGSESFRILPNPSESCSIFPRILRFATMVFDLLLCRKVRIALIAGSQSDLRPSSELWARRIRRPKEFEPPWRGEPASTSLRPIWLGIK